jgi:hypothetical protein
MFWLYHSEGCNIFEMVLHECYVNDLHTTTCSGMLGHHMNLTEWAQSIFRHLDEQIPLLVHTPLPTPYSIPVHLFSQSIT